MTYDVVLNQKPLVSWSQATEKKNSIDCAVRLTTEETWNEQTLDKNIVVEIRLKAATLDRIYDRLNWGRDSMKSDILLEDRISHVRYIQAIDHLSGRDVDFTLLKNFATRLNVDLDVAAKHCIFCYEDNMLRMAKSEEQLLDFEHRILAAASFDELVEIRKEWDHSNRNQL
jgi:hypothetical protein